MRTDVVDGFLLDRGFQALLTAYPEARQGLDYQRLELKSSSRMFEFVFKMLSEGDAALRQRIWLARWSRHRAA